MIKKILIFFLVCGPLYILPICCAERTFSAEPDLPYGSVLRIYADEGMSRSAGSGVLCEYITEKGRVTCVVTASHVIGNARNITCTINGESRSVTPVKVDRLYDYAILVPPVGQLPKPAKFARLSETPQTGAVAWLVGYGGNGVLSRTKTTFRGLSKPRGGDAADWFNVSGAAVSGDSGGPMFTEKGEVVGIVWGASDRENTSVIVQNGRIIKGILEVSHLLPLTANEMQYGGCTPGGGCIIGNGPILGGIAQRNPGREVVPGGGGYVTPSPDPVPATVTPATPATEPMLPSLYGSIEKQGDRVNEIDKRLTSIEAQLGIIPEIKRRSDEAAIIASNAVVEANQAKEAVSGIDPEKLSESVMGRIMSALWSKLTSFGTGPGIIIGVVIFFLVRWLLGKVNGMFKNIYDRLDVLDGVADGRIDARGLARNAGKRIVSRFRGEQEADEETK